MNRQIMDGITIRRFNTPSKYDTVSKERFIKCDCCSEPPAIQILTTKTILKEGQSSKITHNKLYLCEKHRDVLKEYLAYFE